MATRTSIIEVERRERETTGSLVRRFSKRSQQAKVVVRARGLRFYARKRSQEAKKKQALRRIARFRERERLRKLGKIN